MDQYIRKGTAEYWQAISSLFLGSFATFAILYSPQPLIAIFAEQFSVTPAIASLTVSLATGPLAVCMLFAAWISDAVGRKKIMVTALLLSAVLMILAAFCTDFRALLLIRTLHGIVLAGFPAIAMVYVSEEFDPAITGLAIGIFISGNSVGGLTGRLVVSAIGDFSSWQMALGSIGVISLLGALWFSQRLPESRHFSARRLPIKTLITTFLHLVHNPLLLGIYVISFLIMGSFVTLYNYIGCVLLAPPYQLSQTLVGFIFVVYLVGTVSSTVMGKLSDSEGKAKVMSFGLVIMLVGCLITLNPNLVIKIMGIAIFTFGFFGSHSVASSWAGQCTEHDKAQSSALYLLFFYCGASIMGAAGGTLLVHYGWIGVVGLIGMALMTAVGIALALFKYCHSSQLVRSDQTN
jgi:YNFM family putative membrane transporter